MSPPARDPQGLPLPDAVPASAPESAFAPESAAAPEGVRALDHTADVGLEVEAPDLSALFDRAARGMEWLLAPTLGAPSPARASERARRSTEVDITLYAPELPVLLADWLRELLYLRQVRGQRFEGARFQQLSGTALLARVRLAPVAGDPVREIKGVTYHGLEAGRAPGGGWRARVIMDV